MDKGLSLEREIFISYAWGEETEEREAYVNRLYKAFADQGIRIIRDKEVLDYKGRIRAFMKRLGRGKYVIVVISDKYLKSPNCMFELVQIAKNGDFYDRIFPVVLPDAKIYDAEDRADYVIYWEGKSYSLNEKLRQLSSQANVPSLRKSIDDYDEIRSTIDRLVDILYDINTLKPNLISKSDFETLRNAIDEQIHLDEQPMPAEPVPESPVIPDNPSANPSQEQYRQKVRDLINNGEISDIGLDLLEHLREDLNLSSEIAIQIKNQELELARKPVRNRQRYQQLVQKVIDNAYPLMLSDERALDIAQQTLGISDRDADRIQKTLFTQKESQIQKQRELEDERRQQQEILKQQEQTRENLWQQVKQQIQDISYDSQTQKYSISYNPPLWEELNSLPDDLRSENNFDYKPLRDLLKAKKWQAADRTTYHVMLHVADRASYHNCFSQESIYDFPCADLQTIDQLWVKYSQGHFGFSIQKQIWLRCGGKVNVETTKKLADALGWRENDMIYSPMMALLAHLPGLCGGNWQRDMWVFPSLAQRLVTCCI